MATLEIYHGDNLPVLEGFEDESFDLIYIDPPFNTGKRQSRRRTRVERDPEAKRKGFGGHRYRTIEIGTQAFDDRFSDYVGFLAPRLEAARRLLRPSGSLFVHIDFREVHYVKVFLDSLFGRESFQNEIIWSYDYGARSKRRWSPKHDNILWYAKDPKNYTFRYDDIDRIPYMAPGLVGKEKAARGKTPTDSWWHTIVSPTGKERTGYPTQKPLPILSRIVRVHSNPGDRVLDFFAGSGTFGEAALREGRSAVLVDQNPQAITVMTTRLERFNPKLIAGPQPPTRKPRVDR
ncbi:MAG: site-specific DNA-methyltransferase [Myxococcota bacterium]